MIMITDVS